MPLDASVWFFFSVRRLFLFFSCSFMKNIESFKNLSNDNYFMNLDIFFNAWVKTFYSRHMKSSLSPTSSLGPVSQWDEGLWASCLGSTPELLRCLQCIMVTLVWCSSSGNRKWKTEEVARKLWSLFMESSFEPRGASNCICRWYVLLGQWCVPLSLGDGVWGGIGHQSAPDLPPVQKHPYSFLWNNSRAVITAALLLLWLSMYQVMLSAFSRLSVLLCRRNQE